MSPIRVGIIGLGAMSDYAITGTWGVLGHLRSIQGLSDEYEVVAVANSSIESAQRSIDFHKLPNTQAYGSAEDIAADPRVDLVVVTVKVPHHLRLTKPALQHKKSVFVEWPLGANLAEAEELAKLAADNGVKTIVGLQGRSDPFVQKIKEIVASGQIGRVTSSSATISNPFLPIDMVFKGAEYLMDAKSGQTVFSVFFGHFIDSFTYVLGDFSTVQAILKSENTTVPVIDLSSGEVVEPAHPKTAPDYVFVQGALQSGAVASVSLRSTKMAADKVGYRWYITGTEGEIVISMAEGQWQAGTETPRSIKLAVGKGAEPVDVDVSAAVPPSKAAKVANPGTNTARQYEAFANGDAETVTFETALKTHRLLDRIAAAAGLEI